MAGNEESHCSEAGERNLAEPASSFTSICPWASAVTVRPLAVIGKRKVFSAGSAAASGVRTTITSRQPPTSSAVNCRSTPGRTFV